MRAFKMVLVLAGSALIGCGDDTSSTDPEGGGGSSSGGGSGSSPRGGDGGVSSGGGSGSSSGGGSGSTDCEEFTACGGDVVGEWNIENVCFENPEVILPITQNEPMCADALLGIEVNASGTYSFDAAGLGATDLVFSMDFETLWTEECVTALVGATLTATEMGDFCMQLQGEFVSGGGFSDASCALEANGCVCALSTGEQSVMSDGPYMVDGNDLVVGAGVNPFCVEGDVLRISVTSSGLTGTFVMRRM